MKIESATVILSESEESQAKEKNCELLESVRETLKLGYGFEDTKMLAIFIIGEIGTQEDIPNLLNFYFTIEKELLKQNMCLCGTLLPKQNLLDAIDKISYRNSKKVH